MNAKAYLDAILTEQTLAEDGSEVEAMEQHRDEVEEILLTEFANSSPAIKFGGSRAKGTMIKDNYDIDIVCYFPREDSEPGASLAVIFENVKKVLQKSYLVVERTSALRLHSLEHGGVDLDFHIDVVPGRWADDSESDSYLHMTKGAKNWLKTNLGKHIEHIENSRAINTIRLAKLWNFRTGLRMRTFVLELLVVKALDGKDEEALGLDKSLTIFWTYLLNNRDSLTVEDPANPAGNDLADLIEAIREPLCQQAEIALVNCQDNWEKIFGPALNTNEQPRISILKDAADFYRPTAPRPWADNLRDDQKW